MFTVEPGADGTRLIMVLELADPTSPSRPAHGPKGRYTKQKISGVL